MPILGSKKILISNESEDIRLYIDMLHSIYLGNQNSDLGVTSNQELTPFSYKEPLLATVVVSTVSYQPITTHYVIVFVCESNKTTCPQIEVEQYCQFD